MKSSCVNGGIRNSWVIKYSLRGLKGAGCLNELDFYMLSGSKKSKYSLKAPRGTSLQLQAKPVSIAQPDWLLGLNALSLLTVKHAPSEPPAVKTSPFNRLPAVLPLLSGAERKRRGGTERWGTSTPSWSSKDQLIFMETEPPRGFGCEPLWNNEAPRNASASAESIIPEIFTGIITELVCWLCN